MKRLLTLLIFTLLLQSCDDGDVIVTTFDFSQADLKYCGTVGNYVFYKVNAQSQESLSLKLATTDSIFNLEENKTYILNGSSDYVNYRSYDGPLGNDYFCRNVPPVSPSVQVDYFGGSGRADFDISYIYDDQEVAIAKKIKITLKDIVLISGSEKIIQETLEMGTIEIALE